MTSEQEKGIRAREQRNRGKFWGGHNNYDSDRRVLLAEVDRLRALCKGLAERVSGQAELLAENAERKQA